MPQATAVIPIPNPHLRYVAVEYSGAFVAMIWDLRDHGVSIQTFKTDSTIKYSPVK
jgi:hypothetical protein